MLLVFGRFAARSATRGSQNAGGNARKWKSLRTVIVMRRWITMTANVRCLLPANPAFPCPKEIVPKVNGYVYCLLPENPAFPCPKQIFRKLNGYLSCLLFQNPDFLCPKEIVSKVNE